MLFYVRGDGGMPMVPVEEIKRWIYEYSKTNDAQFCVVNKMLTKMKNELDAIGK